MMRKGKEIELNDGRKREEKGRMEDGTKRRRKEKGRERKRKSHKCSSTVRRARGCGVFVSQKLNRYGYVFLELFINRRIRSFLSHQKTMQFTNFIKTTVIVRLSASGKHSENLEDMFICKASYAPSISPKGKIGADRTKYGKKQKDGKPQL